MDYIDEIINLYAQDILNSSGMEMEKTFIQHGKTTLYEHSYSVCRKCVLIALKFNLKVDFKSLVRGSLLHDYFLYDWHIKDKSHKLHGFVHAKIAYKNAKADFELNKIESNMIKSHMFPLNFMIPKYKESIILTIADKLCAISETFSRVYDYELIIISKIMMENNKIKARSSIYSYASILVILIIHTLMNFTPYL